jgi:ABC-type multidrug transport system ATPase subunit
VSPPLVVTVGGQERQLRPGDVCTVGSDAACDLRVSANGFHGRVLRVRHLMGDWRVEVFDDSREYLIEVNGAAVAARAIRLPAERLPCELAVRRRAAVIVARFSNGASAALPQPPGTPGDAGQRFGPVVTIGRTGGGASYEIDDPTVALRHATLTPAPNGGFHLRDTSRGAGTFVDGRRVMFGRLPVGGLFTIGATELVIGRGGRLERWRPLADRLVVEHVTARYPHGGHIALSDVSLTLGARELLAVLGPSGAGKTSLFKAIVGEITIVAGQIRFDGRDLKDHIERIRHRLGYVPQEDHLHDILTARQVLDYTLRLRQHADLGEGERGRWVRRLAERFGIESRLDGRVRELSGGEKKRLSIAVETVVEPYLLMLDEPTSGLDPGMAREVMRCLAGIAQGGCPVALVTHSTELLEGVDKALVVAPGGAPVFLGPPSEVLRHQGDDTYADLMTRLRDSAPPPGGSVRRPERHPGTRRSPGPAVAAAVTLAPGRGRQVLTLSRRELALLGARIRPSIGPPDAGAVAVASRWFKMVWGLVVYVGAPILGALLAGAISTGDGLGGHPNGNAHALQALSLLVTTVVFSGQALTYGNVVAEFQIIRRERRTGVPPASAVLAKFLVFALVATVQSALLAGVFFAWRSATTSSLFGIDGRVEMWASLALTAIAAMALGLLISACSHQLELAVGFVSAAAICQVALNGVLLDLSGRSLPACISVLLPARWGVAAGAAIIDARRIVPGLPDDALWRHGASGLARDWVVLGALTTVFVALACIVLSWRIRRAAN